MSEQAKPSPLSPQLFYLECTERKPGEIAKLQRFFNTRLTAYSEESTQTANTIFSEIFTARRYKLIKTLQGMRILLEDFPETKNAELSNLLDFLDIDIVTRIMNVTKGQYSAQIHSSNGNGMLEMRSSTTSQSKNIPNLTSYNSDTIDGSNISITASGEARAIILVYHMIHEAIKNSRKTRRKISFSHSLKFF